MNKVNIILKRGVCYMDFESENIEFKTDFVDDLWKEVAAFANTSGGRIIIGKNDKGETIDLDNIDSTYTKITNSVRNSILPDVTMFVKYTLTDEGTIMIDVSEGSVKPYYNKSKGLKPSGVYVRQGASSVPASVEQIRQMIKLSDGDEYESARSLEQDLTFDSAQRTFSLHKTEFSEEKYISLGIKKLGDCLFTNLALLISDQCKHTIKVAVFEDDDNTVFKAHREFSGSVLVQLEDAFEYITLCNNNKSTFSGINRIDHWDYPEEAIRESLLNAVVHRDYSFSGSIIVNINSQKVEFISIGGLLLGLSAEDIKSGISQPRNKKLAEMFHRLNFIESYGTGIRKIYKLYSDCSKQPLIEVTPNAFKITLPNMNMATTGSSVNTAVKYKTVIDFIKENGKITEQQLQELLNVKRTRAYNITKELESDGIVIIHGRGENKYLTLS